MELRPVDNELWCSQKKYTSLLPSISDRYLKAALNIPATNNPGNPG